MEDYSRDLEKELNKYSVPNPFKQSRNWQLLFVSDDGKTIAVKRYKGLVISILVVLIIAILFSCGLTVLYYKSNVEKKSLRLAVETANKALSKATEEKELLNARLFFEKKDEPKIIGNSTSDIEMKNEQSLPAVAKVSKQPVVEKIRVGVEQLSITKTENSRLGKIRFLIRNLSKLKRISGYVFVVLKPDTKKPQDWRILPPVLLKNGEPSVPGRGRFFAINHFKSMNFKFKDTIEGAYQTITIFIYSKPDGKVKVAEKIFEATFPVKVKVVKKPKTNLKKSAVQKPEKKAVSNPVSQPVVKATVAVSGKKVAEEKGGGIPTVKSSGISGAGKTVEKVGNATIEGKDFSKSVIVEGAPENAE